MTAILLKRYMTLRLQVSRLPLKFPIVVLKAPYVRDRKWGFLDLLFAIFVANSVEVYFREVVINSHTFYLH
jgi:hypothetical protein